MRLAPVAVALAAAALAGCGASEQPRVSAPPPEPPPAQPPPPPPPAAAAPARPVRTCRAGTATPLGDERTAFAAVALRRTRALRAPGGPAVASFGLRNVNGHATVFGVLGAVLASDCRPAWYRVQLPVRPNGATGYVRAADLAVEPVRTRIVVDLSERRLVLFRDGRPVLRTRAGIGAASTPTPTGRFYVDQRLIAGDPSGPWGPAAIGISAHSDVLRDWVQGGPIAIHGTNEPWSVGRAASHGCIRLDNAVLRRLFALTPAGTPVVIRA